MWVSYLDWALLDFATADTFRAGAAQLLDNCAGLGLNTVLAQVRPFGDALYRSSLFPWSHLCTGVQGGDPGFDPAGCLSDRGAPPGHRGGGVVNPLLPSAFPAAMPPNLAENNLANTHPDWLCTAGEGYLNPAAASQAQTMWCRGWRSFCRTTRWTAPPRSRLAAPLACIKLHGIHGGIGGGVKSNRQNGCRPPGSSAQALPPPAPHSLRRQARRGSGTAPPRRCTASQVGVCQIILCQIRRRHRRRERRR